MNKTYTEQVFQVVNEAGVAVDESTSEEQANRVCRNKNHLLVVYGGKAKFSVKPVTVERQYNRTLLVMHLFGWQGGTVHQANVEARNRLGRTVDILGMSEEQFAEFYQQLQAKAHSVILTSFCHYGKNP